MNKIGYYRDIVQLQKLLIEFNRKPLDFPKILGLFKEVFEELSNEKNIGAYLMEIDNFCEYIRSRSDYFELPEDFREIIFQCLSLHDYPNRYSMSSPKKILEDINKMNEKVLKQ